MLLGLPKFMSTWGTIIYMAYPSSCPKWTWVSPKAVPVRPRIPLMKGGPNVFHGGYVFCLPRAPKDEHTEGLKSSNKI